MGFGKLLSKRIKRGQEGEAGSSQEGEACRIRREEAVSSHRGDAGSSLDGKSEVGSEEQSGKDRRERWSLDKIKGLVVAIFADPGKPRG